MVRILKMYSSEQRKMSGNNLKNSLRNILMLQNRTVNVFSLYYNDDVDKKELLFLKFLNT